MNQHFSPSARAYAVALLELASESNSAEAIGAELNAIGQVLKDNPTVGLYLADPNVSEDERARTLKTAFTGRVPALLSNFIGVVNSKGKAPLLGEIAAAYAALLDEKLGKIEVDVTTAKPLDAAGVEEVRQLVNKALNKNAIIHATVDESLIGGLVLKVGDQMIDGSVKTQLQTLQRKLLTARK